MRKYVVNLSGVKNWAQLRLVLANTFSLEYEEIETIDELMLPLWDSIIEDTKITVYGMGRMAEDLPSEASNLRRSLDCIMNETFCVEKHTNFFNFKKYTFQKVSHED